MRKILQICTVWLLSLAGGLSMLHAQSYDKLWKQVEQAQQKSLPQTVVRLADDIYRKAEQDKNVPQMLKAYICRKTFQEKLTPDSLSVSLKVMEQWTNREKNPVNKAILHSLLAEEYADLVRRNRHALSSRTPVLEQGEYPEDWREWSISQFVGKIDTHCCASLQDSAALFTTSAEEYVPFTVLETGSRFYQHDMYHLLARRAVSAYKGLSGFEADSLARIRIRSIYESMLDSYRRRAETRDAVVLCTLDYWDWKLSADYGNEPYPVLKQRKEQLNKEYLDTLNALQKIYGNTQACAEVYIKKAAYLRTRSMAEALKVCDEGLNRYPSYKRINELRNIREMILRPQLSVNTQESVYPGTSVNLNVNYRNLSGFTLNLYTTTLSEVPWMDHGINKETYKKYARKLSSVHYDLKPLPGKDRAPEDLPYLPMDTVFNLQMPQKAGVYILQVVPDGGATRTTGSFLLATRFKVLALDLPSGTEFITLDALSGHPIPQTTVSFYSSSDEKERKLLAEIVTDSAGRAILSTKESKKGIRCYVARKGEDTAMKPQAIYMNRRGFGSEAKEEQKVVALLTDRSLYRPGQTVYLKGIVYMQGEDSAQVMQGADCELTLLDANGKELAVKKVKTNDFGSFTTEFVLPTACLNGEFKVRTEDIRYAATFRVEEYKRPTFEIGFTPVAEAYKLGDKVMLKGNVKAFNGVRVQDVPLAYTVTRRHSRPGYWNHVDRPLLSDTIQLDVDGSFSIPLVLDTLSGAADRFGEVYTYQVEATVTDGTGETQTASYHLLAGPKAYSFDVRLPQYICKEDSLFFALGVNNIMNAPQQVKGKYELYQLMEQKRPLLAGEFTANRREDFSAWRQLPSGNYRMKLSVRDSLGREEDSGEYAGGPFYLFSKADKRPAAFTDFFYYKENEEFDELHPAAFLIGTSHKDAYVMMDVFCEQKRIDSRVLHLNDTIFRMVYPYKETYGKGITLLFNLVKEGKMYSHQVYLKKRQPKRTLDLKWEVFRDRLKPGQEEEWRLTIKTPQGMPAAAAEMLATMYDASLDKIYSRDQWLRVIYPNILYGAFRRASYTGTLHESIYFPQKSWSAPLWKFDHFCSPYVNDYLEVVMIRDDCTLEESIVVGYGSPRSKSLSGGIQARSMADSNEAVEIKYLPASVEESTAIDQVVFEEELIPIGGENLQPVAELRTNFAETAFFYPQLRTNEQGEIAFSFTMPQSLTRWDFRGYAHTKEMLTGRLEASAVTAKEFMLTPNMPRFVRVGDEVQVAGTVANLTGKTVKGTVTFALFDPVTEKVLSTQKQKFTAEAGKNSAVHFRFEASDRHGLLGVRMIADGGAFSDGEQHLLPVLSNKEYITETLALPIRSKETRTFSLDSLFNRDSNTATNRRLTVEFTGNPAWYAVQALPSLSQPANDNAISWAASWYANSLAGFIANSQPRIKSVFESWKNASDNNESLLSRLEKNQDVKNILLSESPWLLEATTESEQQARIAILFDANQQANRKISAFTKLKELQNEEGAWSWYKGMSGSRHVTGYITELLVRLPLLTKETLSQEVDAMREKAFGYLHRQALEEFQYLRKEEKRGTQTTTNSEFAMTYLYLIALSGEEVPAESQAAHRYFLSKVKNNLKGDAMKCKAQSAVILKAAGRMTEANEFIASLKEHLVQSDEMGAHFAFHDRSYNWNMLPIPVHVAAMEALHMTGGNEALVEEMQLWLLKQKQTLSWNSPVATADAIYALLCQGSNLLESHGDVRITLGKKVLETASAAKDALPGLGYIKETFDEKAAQQKASKITVEKRDAGIAWGAVYAQYLSPLSDVKQQGGELNVEKRLYVERIAADGSRSLQPVAEGTRLTAGDKIVTRLVIRLDRAMDFVQLKDQRGGCLEPIGSLSGYRWSNSCGYYTEVEDAATHYFFDHLDKGVHVLEYSSRIVRGGTYETGLATIQCAYAPEFASHSAGGTLVVE